MRADSQAVCTVAFAISLGDIDDTHGAARDVFLSCANWVQTLARTRIGGTQNRGMQGACPSLPAVYAPAMFVLTERFRRVVCGVGAPAWE
jgi:hypothetical protein